MNVVKAAINAVPYVGGFVGSLINDYIPTNLSSRRDEFIITFAEELEKVKDQVNEGILREQYFTTIVIETFRNAVATHEQVKIDAYRAILLNTLIAQEPDSDEILMMLHLTNSFTPLHLKLLKLFSNPGAYLANDKEVGERFAEVTGGSPQDLARACFPNYDHEILALTLSELDTARVCISVSGVMKMPRKDLLAPQISQFGRKYLSYISIPKE